MGGFSCFSLLASLPMMNTPSLLIWFRVYKLFLSSLGLNEAKTPLPSIQNFPFLPNPTPCT